MNCVRPLDVGARWKNRSAAIFRAVLCQSLFLFPMAGGGLIAQDFSSPSVFSAAPRSLRQHLVRAQQAADERRYSEAVAELAAIFTADPTGGTEPTEQFEQDYFLDNNVTGTTARSIRGEAHRLLSDLPAQARELYELRMGAEARSLMQIAIPQNDVALLADVARRFFHSKAGCEAVYLLGRWELDQGRPLSAALHFQRLVNFPTGARRFEPELTVLLGVSYLKAGMEREAGEVIAALRERTPAGTISLAGAPAIGLPASGDELTWLATSFGGQGRDPALRQLATTEWLLHRGNPPRNAHAPGGLPLTSLRWRVPMATDRDDEGLIQELRRGHLGQRLPVLPAVQPLAVRDTILVRTPDRVQAIDCESGKRIWEYPWWDTSFHELPLSAQRTSGPTAEIDTRKARLQERLWHDAPYGQMSSDGHQVYFLDGLEFTGNRPRRAIQFGLQAEREAKAVRNELVALDLHREGALAWRVGGEEGGDEPKLANALFLGPPLPLGDQLYQLASLFGEIRLFVLNRQTGKIAWTQQIAHVEEDVVGLQIGRRLFGATPTYADGILICPTSAGAIVAIDLATRSLRWGFRYGSNSPQLRTPFGFNRNFVEEPPPPGSRWEDATVCIAEGCVIVTPVEADKLYCLDLATGRLRWPELARQQQAAPGSNSPAIQDGQFVAGVANGKIVIVERHHLTAINVQDGKLAWQERLALREETGEMPSGRGFLADGKYFLPTTDSRLLAIRTDTGTIDAAIDTGTPFGNLICYKNQVFSYQPDFVSSYYQVEPLRHLVRQSLEQNPRDPWALARQGELLVLDGKTIEALDSLRRAFEIERDDAVRELLVATYLKALSLSFADHYPLADQIEPLITAPRQRLRLLHLLADGFGRLGQRDQALTRYLRLIEETLLGPFDLAADPILVGADSAHQVRLDRWVSVQLAELRAAGTTEQQQVDQAAERLLGASSSVDQLRWYCQFFAFHPQCDAARLQLADKLVRLERFQEAEHWLLAVREHAPPPLQAQAHRSLGDLYALAGEAGPAAVAYGRLAEGGELALADGQTAAAVAKTAVDGLPLPPWPVGKTYVEEASLVANMESGQHGLRVAELDDLLAHRYLVATQPNAPRLDVRDPDGNILTQVSLSHPSNGRDPVQRRGHLLAANVGSDLLVLDVFQRAAQREQTLLWRVNLLRSVSDGGGNPGFPGGDVDNPFDPLDTRRDIFKDGEGRVHFRLGPLTSRGLVYQELRSLRCVDPRSGNILWQRDDVPPGADLFGDEELLFCVDRELDVAQVYRASDGKHLGERAVPSWTQQWTARGRFVLAWEEIDAGAAHELYLLDVWANAKVWSERLPPDSLGTVTGDGRVVVLQPDGRFLIRSLTQAKPLAEVVLIDAREQRAMQFVAMADADLLFTSAAHDSDNRTVRPIDNTSLLIDGMAYAFQRRDGEPLWAAPARIENFAVLDGQPANSPVLWLVRANRPEGERRGDISLLALEVGTGRELFRKLSHPEQPNHATVHVDRAGGKVVLTLPQSAFTIRFTNEPLPAPPPARPDAGDATNGTDET